MKGRCDNYEVPTGEISDLGLSVQSVCSDPGCLHIGLTALVEVFRIR